MKISYSPRYSLSNQEAHALAVQKLPANFKGHNDINLEVVNGYRAFIRNSPNISQIVQVDHVEALKPLTTALKKYILQNPALEPNVTNRFYLEITEREKANKIDPVWLIFVHLRYAAAVSELSKDERNLFKHLVNPQILRGLFESNSWLDHYKAITSIALADDHKNSTGATYTFQNVHYEIGELIDKQILKYFPPTVFYPFPGIGKFGICFLIQSYINQIFPLGLPAANKNDNRIQAHGSKLSRVSFMIHDTLHADVDPRGGTVKAHIINKTEQYYSRGGITIPFVKYYTPLAVKYYIVLMHSLEQIYNKFIQHLLPYYGKNEFQRAMVGFFLIVHELPAYRGDVYSNNDLEDIISSMVKWSKAAQNSKFSWESSFDPLNTSPIDGKSIFCKEQIFRSFVDKHLAKDARILMPSCYYSTSPLPDRAEYIRELVSGYKITNSDRFIDAEIVFRTGQIIKYSLPTLYHKWTNLDDSIGLLKLAGINIIKPDLTGLEREASRKLARDTINQVREQLVILLDDFARKAKFYAIHQFEPQPSLTNKFFTWHFATTTRINATIDKSLEKIKQPKDGGKPSPAQISNFPNLC